MSGFRLHDAPRIAALARAVFARGDTDLRQHARRRGTMSSRLCCCSAVHSAATRGNAHERVLRCIGTIAASLELRSVSEVLTLRTCGAAVSSATKAWRALMSGATHLRMNSIAPESIQHSPP